VQHPPPAQFLYKSSVHFSKNFGKYNNPKCGLKAQRYSYIWAMILLTGATGLVGSHILFQLLSEGKKVRALYRSEAAKASVEKVFACYHEHPKALMEKAEWMQGDILDIPVLEDAFEDITQVIHSAAVVSFNPRRKQEIMETNLNGTRNMVNLSLDFGVEKFGYVSSVAAIGRGKDGLGISEKTEWQNSTQNSDYSLSKYQAEMELWRGTEEGLPVVIINPSIILGPGFWDQSSGKLFSAVYKKFPFYSRGANAFVDVKDVARVMIALMESDIVNESFVLAPWNKTYREVMNAMAEEMGRKKPRIAANGLLIGAAWRYERLLNVFLNKEPGLTKHTAEVGMRVNTYNSEKIMRTLGYSFRPLDETIREYSKLFLKDKKAEHI
jgi:nucleoside-diphosphate-sugar epimerase